MFDQLSGHLTVPVKLTHQINQHTYNGGAARRRERNALRKILVDTGIHEVALGPEGQTLARVEREAFFSSLRKRIHG